MPKRAQHVLAYLIVLVPAFGIGAAWAGEWRYCLAAAPAQHAIYMSAPFAAEAEIDMLEAEFGRALDRAHRPHNSVQCPHGDRNAILAMKRHAIRYSRASGERVIEIDWRP